MNRDYLSWIKKILTEKFGCGLEEIRETAYFEEDLNIGELELMELLADLEEALQLDGLVEERENIETVQDLLDIIEEKVD